MTNKTPAERFWSKVALWDDCWIWIGSKDRQGYGSFQFDGRPRKAHHFLLPALPGPGFECDHLCRNRACVRPSHIEIVTSQVNNLRGAGQAAINAAKTRCPQGHPYDLFVRGKRCCQPCRNTGDRERRRTRRVA